MREVIFSQILHPFLFLFYFFALNFVIGCYWHKKRKTENGKREIEIWEQNLILTLALFTHHK